MALPARHERWQAGECTNQRGSGFPSLLKLEITPDLRQEAFAKASCRIYFVPRLAHNPCYEEKFLPAHEISCASRYSKSGIQLQGGTDGMGRVPQLLSNSTLSIDCVLASSNNQPCSIARRLKWPHA